MAFAIPAAATYFAASAATGYVAMALYASAAIQAVGVVTKNEDLQKLGAVIGLGAGIYGAATGAFGAESTIDGYTATERAAESAAISGETGLAERMAESAATSGVTGTVAPAQVPRGIDPGAVEKATSAKITGAAGPTVPPPTVPPGSVPPGGGGIFGGFNLKDPATMYGTGLIATAGGGLLQGIGTAGTEEGKLEFLRQQEEAKLAEQARRAGNFNFTNVNLGVRPSGARLYRAPGVPIINPYRTPVLPS